jgi:LacI family transcriptional regulator
VDHLVGLGHRKIAYAMQGDPNFSEPRERLDSFCRHLSRHGVDFGPEDVFHVDWDGNGSQRFFEARCGHTALMAHNEGLAAGFIRLAPQFGVKIPEDLSIVGFDSTPFCNELRPSLTAVSQPLSLMGRKAIDLLLDSMSDPTSDPIEVIYPCGLDIRESTTSIHR